MYWKMSTLFKYEEYYALEFLRCLYSTKENVYDRESERDKEGERERLTKEKLYGVRSESTGEIDKSFN